MDGFKIDFPFWLIALFLAILIIPLALSCIGAVYLFARRFNAISLIVSAPIFLAIELLIFANYFDGHFPSPWVSMMGFPFSIFSIFFLHSGMMTFVFISIVGMILNFLAVFSVVNVIVRLFRSRS